MKTPYLPALILTMLVFMTSSAIAWNGTDLTTGTTVTIEDRDAVQLGSIIELYDSSSGRYHDVDIDSITHDKDTVLLQVFDHDMNEARTLEMRNESEDRDLIGF